MNEIERATTALATAEAIVVGAGAGMGVDSGLPDFRGPKGFWRAYPAYAELGLRFEAMANPRWFRDDPELAWGFYGHRLHLYRKTTPHSGFGLIQQIAGDRPVFVFTSNVDGQFQAAGYDDLQVYEVHGSIHHLQCSGPCSHQIWEADVDVTVDEKTFRAEAPLPRCPHCNRVARPNILMFGDIGWHSGRSERQASRYRSFLRDHDVSRLVVIEVGAGGNVPTVRWQSESLQEEGATLVRINPREPEGPPTTISLPMGGLEALQAVATKVSSA